MARIDPEKREEWDAMLEAPLDPRAKARPTDAQIESEGANFMALMGADVQGKVTR